MEKFNDRLNIPSSGLIAEQLGLEYCGQYKPANPDASFSDSLPVITDENPDELQYFPLNIISKYALKEKVNESLLLNRLEMKKHCVIICNSFDHVHQTTGVRHSLNPNAPSLGLIAGFWDATEDPFHMALLLYSCMMLTQPSHSETLNVFERIPCFLEKEQIHVWLNKNLTFEERLNLFE